jgi:hypothetical protein
VQHALLVCFTHGGGQFVAAVVQRVKSFIEACIVEVDAVESARLTASPTACAGVDVESELSMTPREIVAEHPASRGPLGLRLNENARSASADFQRLLYGLASPEPKRKRNR